MFGALLTHAQNAQLDSLAKVLPTLKGADRIPALSDLSWGLHSIDARRSLQYGEELFQLAKGTKDSTEIANAANILAVAYYRSGRYQEALSTNHIAYNIRKKRDDKRAIGSSLNKYVNIYTDQVKLDSALYYGLESLRIFEAIGDSGAIAQTYNALSSIYQKDRNWAESLKCARKCYDISDAIGFVYAKGGAAGNIGICLQEQGNTKEAIEWYEKARTHFEEVGSLVDLGNISINLGVVYRKEGQLEKAYEVYKDALDVSLATGEKSGEMTATGNIGAILNALGRPKEAIPYFERARELADQEKIGRIRLQAYSGLAEAYARTGQGELSTKALVAYIALRDTLYNEERAGLMAEMQTKFEVEKKEQENEFLKKENELKEQEKKRIQIGAIIVIILLLIAAYFYYLGYKRKQETKLQKELVRERERGLEAVFDATEEERKRIAKDLHDGIGQQLSGLKLSWEGLSMNSESSDKMEKLTKVLDEACQEVRTISHQMMPKALGERGLLPALEDMLQKSLGLTSIQYQLEHFKVEGERFNERVEVGLYRVCQELINNIIKHSGASQVNIQFFKNKTNLVLIVEDNGKGFDPTTKKEGIGLMNITSRLSTVSGEVTWEAGPKSGSVATVRVPVA